MAVFYTITGKKEEIIESTDDNITVNDLINMLTRKYGERFQNSLRDQTGKIRIINLILINGKDIRFLDGLGTMLKDDYIVSFALVAAGG